MKTNEELNRLMADYKMYHQMMKDSEAEKKRVEKEIKDEMLERGNLEELDTGRYKVTWTTKPYHMFSQQVCMNRFRDVFEQCFVDNPRENFRIKG